MALRSLAHGGASVDNSGHATTRSRHASPVATRRAGAIMPDFNLSNAEWLVIATVVLVGLALAIAAVYLIVSRSYAREIARLEAEISALRERPLSTTES